MILANGTGNEEDVYVVSFVLCVGIQTQQQLLFILHLHPRNPENSFYPAPLGYINIVAIGQE